MRLSPDERHRRLRDSIISALEAIGGWLSRGPLRLLIGQGEVYADELTRALADLEESGLVQGRDVAHFVGNAGPGCRIYRATGDMYISREVEVAEDGDVVLALHPSDRLSLLEVVHREHLVARDVDPRGADAARWFRIESTLVAAELDNQEQLDSGDDVVAE